MKSKEYGYAFIGSLIVDFTILALVFLAIDKGVWKPTWQDAAVILAVSSAIDNARVYALKSVVRKHLDLE